MIYIGLVIFFAYFYTSVTFNPLEISNNMKKQGGFIPGIRPGKPTTEYLTTVLNSIIFPGCNRNGYRMCAANLLLRCIWCGCIL